MAIVICSQCGAKNRLDPQRAAQATPKCGRCGAPLPAASQASLQPLVVTDASFQRDVLEAGPTPILVDCWAAWCGPCRMLAPTIDQLAAESDGRYRVAKLDVDQNPTVAGRFNISSIPTLLIFQNGQLVDTLVGLLPKPAIAARLAQWQR